MKECNKSLTEVNEILKYLSKEDYQKIPDDVISIIKENMDETYIWNYDTNKPLKEQNISREAVAVLSYLNMQYLLNQEQRNLMKKLHKLNDKKVEEEKLKKYNPDNIFKNNKHENKSKENVTLVEINNQKWYEKVFTFFRKILKK